MIIYHIWESSNGEVLFLTAEGVYGLNDESFYSIDGLNLDGHYARTVDKNEQLYFGKKNQFFSYKNERKKLIYLSEDEYITWVGDGGKDRFLSVHVLVFIATGLYRIVWLEILFLIIF